MKQLLLLMCMLLFSNTQAQSQNEHLDSLQVSNTKPNYTYCTIVGFRTGFGKRVKISVDYGQEKKYWTNESVIKNEDGKAKKFESMMDALNYMASVDGWEFVQAYVISYSNQSVYHFLMKRQIP